MFNGIHTTIEQTYVISFLARLQLPLRSWQSAGKALGEDLGLIMKTVLRPNPAIGQINKKDG